MPTPDTHTLLPWVTRAWAISTLAGNREAGEQWLRASAGGPGSHRLYAAFFRRDDVTHFSRNERMNWSLSGFIR